MVKPLAFPRPGGHNLIIEWDIFYPLPSTWHLPKKPTPVPSPTTTTEAIEVWDPHDHDSGAIWMPGSGWTSDVIEKLKDEPAEKRYWNIPRVNCLNKIYRDIHVFFHKQPQRADRREWNRNNLFQLSPPSSVTQYQNPLLHQMPLQPTNSFYRNQKINPNQRYYKPSLSLPGTVAMNKQRQIKYAHESNFLRSHRERRDLYKRIEASSPL